MPTPIPSETWNNPVVQSIGQTFSLEEFRIPRQPIVIGAVLNRLTFRSPSMLRILDMPVKMLGSAYLFPGEVEPWKETLQKIISWHHAVDPYTTENEYAYLTIDQGFVEPGKTQRNPGCHVDGLQGARVQPKVHGDHSYTCVDYAPTEFYNQPFYLDHLDMAKHNMFLAMENQASPNASVHTYPYTIYMMDAYTVHKAGIARIRTYRTFLRLSFSVRIFDRLGNTPNPWFDTGWEMVPREIHSTLLSPPPL